MRAVFAIAYDTLTLLCRRRLFWLNIWLSVAVVLVVASINCTPQGWSIGFGLKSWESDYLVKGSPWEKTLYFGVVRRAALWWVAGLAPLLALFSLASVVPRTLKSGQAALLFTKTRGRSEVLLGRFAGGLGFAAIPATLCVTGLFLTLGWRLGYWEPRLFFAILFALLFFAVAAAVTVMLGVLTKSASASLVVALIFASSVMALQEAAARPLSPVEDDTGFHDQARPGSGGSLALQAIAWPLPRTQELAEGMDRAIGLKSPKLFRVLVRRWQVGQLPVGAAAVDALVDSAQPAEEVTPLKLGEAIMVTSGFCGMTLVAAALMLNRRDL